MLEERAGEWRSWKRDATGAGAGLVALLFIVKGDFGGRDGAGERPLESL